MQYTLINSYRFNLIYIHKMLTDFDKKQMKYSIASVLEIISVFTLGYFISEAV
jgi:hypothetical protein